MNKITNKFSMLINLEIKSEQTNKRYVLNKRKMKESFEVTQFFSLISLRYTVIKKFIPRVNVRN